MGAAPSSVTPQLGWRPAGRGICSCFGAGSISSQHPAQTGVGQGTQQNKFPGLRLYLQSKQRCHLPKAVRGVPATPVIKSLRELSQGTAQAVLELWATGASWGRWVPVCDLPGVQGIRDPLWSPSRMGQLGSGHSTEPDSSRSAWTMLSGTGCDLGDDDDDEEPCGDRQQSRRSPSPLWAAPAPGQSSSAPSRAVQSLRPLHSLLVHSYTSLLHNNI